MNGIASNRNTVIYYFLSIFFILGGLLIYKSTGSYFVIFIPFILIIIYMAFFSLENLMLLVVLLTPLSINIYAIPGLGLGKIGIGMALPTEPIMFGIMLLFILYAIYKKIDIQLIRHPVSIIIISGIAWMFITMLSSTMLFVSFKYFIQRTWGVITFYFLGLYLFSKKKNIVLFLWLYAIGLFIVIIYTLVRQSKYHFTEQAAHFTVQPFYNDHTAYGALLAMFIPVLGGLMFIHSYNNKGKYFAPFLFLFFFVALALSYSRAAWVSILVSIAFFIMILMQLRLKSIMLYLSVVLVLFYVFQTVILIKLERNHKEVSQNVNSEIQSISNISSDASNLERINRWSCAIRMFKDKPLLGFGPGTYMFKYAPYQLSSQRTIISTNLGTGGNAHSEYLGPLSEQGLLGMLLFIALVVSLFIISFRLMRDLNDREDKILVISIFLGLLTYFIHGALNNFLDTDKAAVPFWGLAAMLVAIDLQNKLKPQPS